MTNSTRQVLISRILSSEGTFEGKYTNSFNILKGIITLESKETKHKLPNEYFNRFNEIEDMYFNLDKRVKGFSLRIVEEYFFRNRRELDKYIYMHHQELETTDDLLVMDLFEILENFFMQIYILALEIGDFYSIEIKLKKANSNKEELF